MFRQLGVEGRTLADLSALEKWLAAVGDPNADPWPDFQPDPEPLSPDAPAIDPTAGFDRDTDDCEDEGDTPGSVLENYHLMH